MKLLDMSPPIKSKVSKLKAAGWQFDSKKRRKEVFEGGFGLDNPGYLAFAKTLSATTNIPLDRLLIKLQNIMDATAEDTENWQRIALILGWPKWQLEPEKEEAKEKKVKLPKLKGAINPKKMKAPKLKNIILNP